MKKDLLNRTGNSPEQTVITCMRKKKKKQKKNRCLCITESSSGIPKIKHRKSTLLQYKITIQLQIKLPELGLREIRQP